MKKHKFLFIENLYAQVFNESFHITKREKAELRQNAAEYRKSHRQLRQFFSLIKSHPKDHLPKDKVNAWRGELYDKIEEIESTQRSSSVVLIKSFIAKMKRYGSIQSRRMLPYALAAGLCALFFVFGVTYQNYMESPKLSVLEQTFLPGTTIRQLQFLKKPSDESNKTELFLQAVTPMKIEGDVRDPYIRNTITKALLTSSSPMEKLECISILSSSEDLMSHEEIRSALHYVLKHDNSPKVRHQVLEMLTNYDFSPQTQLVIVDVMKNDPNHFMRCAAASIMVNKIESFSTPLDGNVEKTLASRLSTEENLYIKEQIMKVLYSRQK